MENLELKDDKLQFVYKTGSYRDYKIKENVIEMRNCIRLYPTLVVNMFPEDNEVWELLMSFPKIFEILSSPSYIVTETLVLRDMIEEFLVGYLRIIPETTLKQKDPFLTHYPSQILEVVPPLYHITIRFEAKYKFLRTLFIEVITQSI